MPGAAEVHLVGPDDAICPVPPYRSSAVEGIHRISEVRHQFSHWESEAREDVPLAVSKQALDWLIAAHSFRVRPTSDTKDSLYKSLALLGVSCWWALNRYAQDFIDVDEIDLAGRGSERHPTEDWQLTQHPVREFERVALIRLQAAMTTIEAYSNTADFEQKVVRQFLFLTHEIESMLDLIDQTSAAALR